MELGKVKGQVVSTVRDPHLPPCSLLLVALCDSSGKEIGIEQVAADALGAGHGEWVLLTRGSSARQGFGNAVPVDLCVVGIIDEVTGPGTVHYSKSGS